MTSNTPETQALLPVTAEDRDAAADMVERDVNGVHTGERSWHILGGHLDGDYRVQAFARHRISHSLPGDVGRLVRAANNVLAAMDAYNAENGTHLGGPAYFELGRSIAAITTPPTPDRIGKDAVREALVNAKYALEYWERESKVWSDSRVPGARPGWMYETRRRGREEIARITRALSAAPAQEGE